MNRFMMLLFVVAATRLLHATAQGQDAAALAASTNAPASPPAPTAPTPYTAPAPVTVTPTPAWIPADPYALPPVPPPKNTRPVPFLPPSATDLLTRGLRRPSPLALPAATLSGVETAKVTDATVETVQPASGPRVWHVSQFGSDIAAGTQAQPLQTIQRAANLAKPGDTVVVAAGIYQGFRTVRGGTAQAPITFRGHGRGTTITSPPGDYQDNILVSATDNVIIEGFEVRDAPRAGIAILKSAGVIVRQNSVGASGKWGIFSGFAPRLEIVENETFGARLEHGIYVSNSDTADDNPVVRGNHSHHNGGSGIQLNGDCLAGGDGVLTGALVENNVVHDNAYKGLSLISIQSSVVQNNVVYDNGKKAGAAGIHLADNPGGDRPSDNNSIVNNTIVESQIAGIRITGRSSGNVVFNNLIVGPESIRDEAGANHIDESSNVLALTSAGLFVNAANGDYRLAAGGNTRARGRGAVAGKKAPTQDLDGKPRGTDVLAVGAYE